MRLSKYPVNIHDENTYWFISTGRTGNIIKAVLFQELPEDNRVNLAMGDAGKTGEINFEDLSNNGDTRKVFNTIGKIVKNYTKSHPRKRNLCNR